MRAGTAHKLMHIEHLSLTNFRNYARLEWTIPQGTTVIHGANAQGKTSLLEAIYYLATSRSPYTNSDRQLIHWRAETDPIPFARLAAEVSSKRSVLDRIEMTLMFDHSTGDGPRIKKFVKTNCTVKHLTDLVRMACIEPTMPRDPTD